MARCEVRTRPFATSIDANERCKMAARWLVRLSDGLPDRSYRKAMCTRHKNLALVGNFPVTFGDTAEVIGEIA